MNKLIIIGLLALCAECAWADHFDMGESGKPASGRGTPHRSSVTNPLLNVQSAPVSNPAPTKSQQIAQIWHIQPGEIGKPIRLFGKGN